MLKEKLSLGFVGVGGITLIENVGVGGMTLKLNSVGVGGVIRMQTTDFVIKDRL